ncbi:MAG: hypothetical protein U0271_05260 [Polyangiaceae bacterium]
MPSLWTFTSIRQLAFALSTFTALGCGDDTTNTGGAGGAGGAHGGSGGSGAGFVQGGSGGIGGFGACTEFVADAQQAPAALLIVLDRTASMGTEGKWDAAQTAILGAVDKDVFDTMSLGLLTFPEPASVPGPDCIFNYPIYCDVTTSPQVTVSAAGTDKSDAATGVRRQIADYLSASTPQNDDSADSSPIYPALNAAYSALRAVPDVDRRAVLLVTDGGGSCASVANPSRPAYMDSNGCFDWDEPPYMAALIGDARNDPTAPVETFIVGVPGSASHGDTVGGYSTPPYSMLLALSTYAVAGSPDTVDPSCDKNAVFDLAGADPTTPCHFDLSNSATFNATILEDAIATLRRKALGCTYDLPAPPPGQTVDPNKVNVLLTVDGAAELLVPRRSDAADACTGTPCWDYDASDRVELIGAACSAVSEASSARVEIDVGCATKLK